MPLLETIIGEATSDESVAYVYDSCFSWTRLPIAVRDFRDFMHLAGQSRRSPVKVWQYFVEGVRPVLLECVVM